MDPEGYVFKVALYLAMFFNGLSLPFFCPIHDVLDLAGMDLAHPYPNAWRIFMSYCIIWWCTLKEVGADWPNLTDQNFFLTHNILKKAGSLADSVPFRPWLAWTLSMISAPCGLSVSSLCWATNGNTLLGRSHDRSSPFGPTRGLCPKTRM